MTGDTSLVIKKNNSMDFSYLINNTKNLECLFSCHIKKTLECTISWFCIMAFSSIQIKFPAKV